MKKILALILALAMCTFSLVAFTSCDEDKEIPVTVDTAKNKYTVGICQLMKHDSLDAATNGFIDTLKAEIEKEGKTVSFDSQVAGEPTLCTTVVNTLVSKEVDIIMANATPRSSCRCKRNRQDPRTRYFRYRICRYLRRYDSRKCFGHFRCSSL